MNRTPCLLSPNGQTVSLGEGPLLQFTVGTVDGIHVLERAAAGQPWSLVHRSLAGHHVGALIHDAITGKLLAGLHAPGGIRSAAFAAGRPEHWHAADAGIGPREVYCLASAAAPGRAMLYAGVDPAALFVSRDGGATWREAEALQHVPDRDKWTFPVPPHIAHVKALLVHPDDPDVLYVMVEQGGLFCTTDGGESFTEIAGYSAADDYSYRDIHRLLILPADERRMMLVTGSGVYRSLDDGMTWAQLSDHQARLGYPDHVFADPTNYDRLLVAGTDTDPGHWWRTGATCPGLLVSQDGGDRWQELDLGWPRQAAWSIEAMAQHIWLDDAGLPCGSSLILATSAGALWISDDAGRTWSMLDVAVPPVSKESHHRAFAAHA